MWNRGDIGLLYNRLPEPIDLELRLLYWTISGSRRAATVIPPGLGAEFTQALAAVN